GITATSARRFRPHFWRNYEGSNRFFKVASMLNRKVSRVSRLKVGTMLAVAVVGMTSLTTNIIRPVSAAVSDQLNSGASQDLSDPTNWSLGTVPTGSNTVLLNSAFTNVGTTNTFLLTSNQTWGGIQVLGSYATGVSIGATSSNFITMG